MQADKNIDVHDEERHDPPTRTVLPNRWLTRLFGCRHRNMSPPFTGGNETYRSCMRCGARRLFNVERGKMTGAYYYAPISSLYESHEEKGRNGDR
ncbi:MAG: hypothetical protein QOH49_1806 [Acidobacteriota bacterium]|jgi:hypothetical protein|nr:hypothetical protein [Acidobacteriota bacterium]